MLPYLDEIDLLLVMSVNPGWGGQGFIPEVLDKVRVVRKVIDERGLDVEIEIDGGINVTPLPRRPRPASTSSSPAARCSAPPTRSQPRARSVAAAEAVATR